MNPFYLDIQALKIIYEIFFSSIVLVLVSFFFFFKNLEYNCLGPTNMFTFKVKRKKMIF